MANNERQPGAQPEQEVHFEQREIDASQERLAALHERRAELERSPEATPEKARHEALEQAKKAEKTEVEREPRETSPAERRPQTKKAKAASFDRTMESVQAELTGPSRAFSKVIHNKAVEQTSELAAKTIARPNAILAGSMAAFAATLLVYLIAKQYGYPLSGFEAIGAFIVGWIIGQLFDFFRVMITGRP